VIETRDFRGRWVTGLLDMAGRLLLDRDGDQGEKNEENGGTLHLGRCWQ